LYALLGFSSVFSSVKGLGMISAPAYQLQAGALLLLSLLLMFYLWWHMGKTHDSTQP